MLWGTEILFRNLNAALLHGRMLRHMVEDQAEKGTLDLIAFRYILYYDMHLCTMLMVRSVSTTSGGYLSSIGSWQPLRQVS